MKETVQPLLKSGKLEGLFPNFGGICFFSVPSRDDAASTVEAMRREKVYVTPGIHFGVPSHFRLNYAVKTDALKVGLQVLADAVA